VLIIFFFFFWLFVFLEEVVFDLLLKFS
jgi:hypothetical protein